MCYQELMSNKLVLFWTTTLFFTLVKGNFNDPTICIFYSVPCDRAEGYTTWETKRGVLITD